MDQVTQPVSISITHYDVGATIQTVIRVNGLVVASYMPATRHFDRAEEAANRIMQTVLTELFAQAIEKDEYSHSVPEEYMDEIVNPYGDDEDWGWGPEPK